MNGLKPTRKGTKRSEGERKEDISIRRGTKRDERKNRRTDPTLGDGGATGEERDERSGEKELDHCCWER
jgi:hypothetical protein